ncbi:nitrile hydratase subunit alpha [Enterovirga sp.]|uniref:nitrile hydratase subunit alpha n=1 Tax=Enterovirga sp. TaxID=2026350 RepID=UPI002622DA66|nr:nitrile hydratase subunit alpha [Enterovirga sp.]MDB5591652.1 putative nitrile hydratase alpha subunit [Enterovirga sp.]
MNVREAESGRLLAALTSLLSERGLISDDELAARMAITESASPKQGARIVARAWTDPGFRERLLADGTAAVEEAGVFMRGLPPLGVLENTSEVHNVVVCTLCSCYPRAVLGYPPFWFKSPGYRARTVRDPRGVLAEWGTAIPEDVRIRVVDSTADYRWMVLPMRPAGTEGWSAEALADLVRDSDMIGVTQPKASL